MKKKAKSSLRVSPGTHVSLAHEIRKAVKSYPKEVGDRHWKLEERLLKSLKGAREFTKNDLLWIGEWKAYNRTRHWLKKNRDSEVRKTTRRAFKERDVTRKVEILMNEVSGLYGVDTRTASAILMFHNPKGYTVMDKRVWCLLEREGFLGHTSAYSPVDYRQYQDVCKRLSAAFKMSLRDLDRGLWVLGD